jgi:hypothetical protein
MGIEDVIEVGPCSVAKLLCFHPSLSLLSSVQLLLTMAVPVLLHQ